MTHKNSHGQIKIRKIQVQMCFYLEQYVENERHTPLVGADTTFVLIYETLQNLFCEYHGADAREITPELQRQFVGF